MKFIKSSKVGRKALSIGKMVNISIILNIFAEFLYWLCQFPINKFIIFSVKNSDFMVKIPIYTLYSFYFTKQCKVENTSYH